MTRQHRELKIVAAGEDFAAVLRAQELAKRLAAQLEPMFTVASGAWKYEALGSVPTRKEAARRAADADMVIIAASGETEPPTNIKSWIENWLPRKHTGATALVALLDHEDEALHASSPLCAYLRRVAGKWGADFFSNSSDWWRQHHDATIQAPQRQGESHQPAAFSGLHLGAMCPQ